MSRSGGPFNKHLIKDGKLFWIKRADDKNPDLDVCHSSTGRFCRTCCSISVRADLNISGELELRDGSNRVIANETLESVPFGAVKVL